MLNMDDWVYVCLNMLFFMSVCRISCVVKCEGMRYYVFVSLHNATAPSAQQQETCCQPYVGRTELETPKKPILCFSYDVGHRMPCDPLCFIVSNRSAWKHASQNTRIQLWGEEGHNRESTWDKCPNQVLILAAKNHFQTSLLVYRWNSRQCIVTLWWSFAVGWPLILLAHRNFSMFVLDTLRSFSSWKWEWHRLYERFYFPQSTSKWFFFSNSLAHSAFFCVLYINSRWP